MKHTYLLDGRIAVQYDSDELDMAKMAIADVFCDKQSRTKNVSEAAKLLREVMGCSISRSVALVQIALETR